MSCMFVEWQAPLMALWKPAAWMPGIRNLHSTKQQWIIKSSPDGAFRSIRDAMQQLSDQTMKNGDIGKPPQFRVGKINERERTLQMLVFTGMKWMDSAELTLIPEKDYTRANLFSSSTGLFPLSVPFAAALNVIFFWFPFSDMGKNAEWLSTLRKTVQEGGIEIDVVK